jgi:hypothetical protein
MSQNARLRKATKGGDPATGGNPDPAIVSVRFTRTEIAVLLRMIRKIAWLGDDCDAILLIRDKLEGLK